MFGHHLDQNVYVYQLMTIYNKCIADVEIYYLI